MENFTLYIICGIIILSFILLFCKMKKGVGNYNLKIYGITLVVSLASLLALCDIPQTNLTAVYGIFGAIIGYLFGLKSNKKQD